MGKVAKRHDPHARARVRAAGLEALADLRFSSQLPDNSEGLEFLKTVFGQIAHLPDGRERAKDFAEKYATQLPGDVVQKLIDHLAPEFPTSAELGQRVRLTDAERTKTKLWQARAIDVTDEELAERERKRKVRVSQAGREKAKQKKQKNAGQIQRAADELDGRPAAMVAALTALTTAKLIDLKTLARAVMHKREFQKRGGGPLPLESLCRILREIVDQIKIADAEKVKKGEPAPSPPLSHATPPRRAQTMRGLSAFGLAGGYFGISITQANSPVEHWKRRGGVGVW